MQTDSVENVFARAWSLLSTNWVIIVPGLVVGIVAGIIQAIVAPHTTVTYDANGNVDTTALIAHSGHTVIRSALSAIVGIVAFLVTETYTTGMAGAAWSNGATTLADGAASFREDAGRLLAAILLVAVLGIVVGLLTLGLGWFVVIFFTIYVAPAVVLDNRGAIDALKLSATIARKRFAATIIIILLLAVIGFAVSLAVIPLVIVPFLGPIIVMLVTQALAAYITMVIVGEYLNVHRSPDIIAAGPPAV